LNPLRDESIQRISQVRPRHSEDVNRPWQAFAESNLIQAALVLAEVHARKESIPSHCNRCDLTAHPKASANQQKAAGIRTPSELNLHTRLACLVALPRPAIAPSDDGSRLTRGATGRR